MLMLILASVVLVLLVLVGGGLLLAALAVLVLSSSLVFALVFLLAAVIVALVVFWFVFRVHHLPLRLIGLARIPAVPVILWQVPITVVRLLLRLKQMQLAYHGLSPVFTIGGHTAPAHSFMFGTGAEAPLKALTLDRPEQFSMSWTTLGNLYDKCQPQLLPAWARSMTFRADATAQFWPTIAANGVAYNLVVLEKVSDARAATFSALLGPAVWAPLDAQRPELYAIDMTFLQVVEPQTVKGFPRFTPATLTFLKRSVAPGTGKVTLTPIFIRVTGQNGVGAQNFDGASTDDAWLYAIHAAKASITVWGIWLGHVYHWHVVTAAMQMTMFNNLPRTHIVRQLFGRQSDYLIAFDETLLIGWPFIAPPTSISTALRFLKLMDAFAMGRQFFDDDLPQTLAALGLRKQDFTVVDDWDQYPVVADLAAIWKATEAYVGTIVDRNYAQDSDVDNDDALQDWIDESGDASGGNVQGLPRMNTVTALKQVLTSLIYRVTAHGATRMYQALTPAITFFAHYPPCLQDETIPAPNSTFGPGGLFAYLPRTGTIGEQWQFLGIFTYSTPYKSFIPLGGIDAELSFEGPTAADCNLALRNFRIAMAAFMKHYADSHVIPGPGATPDSVQLHQWPLNIET